MEYRQVYEVLLQTQCASYQNMLEILTRIERLDDALAGICAQDMPSPEKIDAISAQKEYLIQKLDSLSLHAKQAHEELEGMSGLCQEITAHPLYPRMEALKLAAYRRVSAVIEKEDLRNPDIIRRLENYREALTLDIKIKDIPLSKRQLFVYIPNRGKP